MTEKKEKEKEKVIEPEVVGEVTQEEKQLAMLSHILAIVAGFLVPLIIYLIKKDESEFIEDQAKESLNFQIAVTIAMFICGAFAGATCGYGAIISIPIMFAVGIVDLIFCILAGLKANEGERYRYPVTIRFIK